MTLNKFGSHLLSKYGDGSGGDDINNAKIVTEAQLFYHISLAFIGHYNETERKFVLDFTKKTSFTFPLSSGTIIAGEYPKSDVTLLVNETSGKIEGRKLKKGDSIEFSRKSTSNLKIFYGELIVKCPVLIE